MTNHRACSSTARRVRAIVIGPAVCASITFAACLFPSVDGFTGGDASRDDGGEGDAAGAACPSVAEFCDDFEDGGTTAWNNGARAVPPPAAVAVYSRTSEPASPPPRGTSALHARTAGSDGGITPTAFLEKSIATRSAGAVAIRSYLYVSAPVIQGTAWFSLLGRNGDLLAAFILLRAGRGGFWEVGLFNDDGTNRLQVTSSTLVTSGTWLCVESVFVLGDPGHVTVFVNQVRVIDADTTTVPNPSVDTYSAVRAGLVSGPPAGTADAFLDDVAIATFDAAPSRGVPVLGCE